MIRTRILLLSTGPVYGLAIKSILESDDYVIALVYLTVYNRCYCFAVLSKSLKLFHLAAVPDEQMSLSRLS